MKLKNKKAFTIVEILTGITVGTLAFAALSFSLGSSNILARKNRTNLYALTALIKELDDLRRTNYDTFVALGNSSTFTNSELIKLPSGSGTANIEATSFGADIKKVTLTVSWVAGDQTTNQSVSTYITRKGLNGS